MQVTKYQQEAQRLLDGQFIPETVERIEHRYFQQFSKARDEGEAIMIWRKVKALRDVAIHINSAAEAAAAGQLKQGETEDA